MKYRVFTFIWEPPDPKKPDMGNTLLTTMMNLLNSIQDQGWYYITSERRPAAKGSRKIIVEVLIGKKNTK